jgi:hypothetical protein
MGILRVEYGANEQKVGANASGNPVAELNFIGTVMTGKHVKKEEKKACFNERNDAATIECEKSEKSTA